MFRRADGDVFDDERAGFVDSMVPSESIGLELDGILGSLRVIGGGRFFPPAAGASRVGTGSSGTGAGAGVSETASCSALKLRFFRIGVAIGIKRENPDMRRVNKGISDVDVRVQEMFTRVIPQTRRPRG